MHVLMMLLIPLIAACSTMNPSPSPSAAVGEPSGVDIAGRWTGSWTGGAMFHSTRNDAVTMDLVQLGDRGHGRILLEGAIAAESVPQVIRFQGLNGIRVVAEISNRTVKLRHELDRRLFTADLQLSGDGDRMFGLVRGSEPALGLLLTREGRRAPEARPLPAPQPVPVQSQVQPEPEPAKNVVAMVVPAPAPERPAEAKPADERPRQEEFIAVQELTAIHFDFDRATIRPDAGDALMSHAAWLKDHGDTAVLIEGHCDERGTAEYNLALGDRRAKSVKDYLTTYGVAPDRISTVSYGKERLACTADTPACHEENRRAEFRIKTR